MANVDPITSLADWLKVQTTVAAVLAADRVYRGELPDGTYTYMPRSAVILAAAGGPADMGLMNLGRQRVDVRVYGTKLVTARATFNIVHQALKNLSRVVFSGALLHSLVLEGGPIETREPQTSWPVVFASYLLLYAERT